MRTCIMHVGHGKTGTSFLQSSLALSESALVRHGFYYPPYRGSARQASGGLGSGNGRVFFDERNAYESHFSDHVGRAASLGLDRILYSSEFLFRLIREDPTAVGRLRRALDAASPNPITLEFVLYIRNPFDHAMSSYQQLVKRGGHAGSFDEHLANAHYVDRVARFLDVAEAEGVGVTVLNYSRVQSSLVQSFETAIGLPQGTLQVPDTATINRGLTRFELEVQRLFNLHLDRKSSGFVSDPLVELLPEVSRQSPAVSRAALEDFLQRAGAAAQTVNTRLPSEHRYAIQTVDDLDVTLSDSDKATDFTVSAKQLEVLVTHVAKAMETPASLAPAPAPAPAPARSTVMVRPLYQRVAGRLKAWARSVRRRLHVK